jgi:hypothetical protein
MAPPIPAPTGVTWGFTAGLIAAVLAAAALVIGVQLFVTCAPATTNPSFGPSVVGCSYPYQPWGIAAVTLAGLLFVLAGVWFHQDLRRRGQLAPLAERK